MKHSHDVLCMITSLPQHSLNYLHREPIPIPCLPCLNRDTTVARIVKAIRIVTNTSHHRVHAKTPSSVRSQTTTHHKPQQKAHADSGQRRPRRRQLPPPPPLHSFRTAAALTSAALLDASGRTLRAARADRVDTCAFRTWQHMRPTPVFHANTTRMPEISWADVAIGHVESSLGEPWRPRTAPER